jgi:hypothetical protein
VGRLPDDAPTRWTNDAVSYGRENPLLGLLLALGTGIGLGWLASARRERAPKNLIPAMAGAVTKAVHEAIKSRL